ncbi:MAG: hypothetical protein JNM80_12845 [Phycisphaerae bacterium]|nr:hypothetical protein [Phycisphaerae bacterium]
MGPQSHLDVHIKHKVQELKVVTDEAARLVRQLGDPPAKACSEAASLSLRHVEDVCEEVRALIDVGGVRVAPTFFKVRGAPADLQDMPAAPEHEPSGVAAETIASAVLRLSRDQRKILAELWADMDRATRRHDRAAQAAALAAAAELFESTIPTEDITND